MAGKVNFTYCNMAQRLHRHEDGVVHNPHFKPITMICKYCKKEIYGGK